MSLLLSKARFVHKKDFCREVIYHSAFENANTQHLLANVACCLNAASHFYKSKPKDTTTVGVVAVQEQSFVIKRYNFRNFFHAVKLQFRKSHGFRSFLYADYLSQLGIETINPVAVIQEKRGFLKRKSYFISQYEIGMPGCMYFNDDSVHQSSWQQTIDLIFGMIRKMRAYFICHGDFHLGNLLIVEGKPILLDFDHVRIVKNPWRFMRLHRKDMQNFIRYLLKNTLAYQIFKQHPDFKRYFDVG